jgi:hypothetical protein
MTDSNFHLSISVIDTDLFQDVLNLLSEVYNQTRCEETRSHIAVELQRIIGDKCHVEQILKEGDELSYDENRQSNPLVMMYRNMKKMSEEVQKAEKE